MYGPAGSSGPGNRGGGGMGGGGDRRMTVRRSSLYVISMTDTFVDVPATRANVGGC